MLPEDLPVPLGIGDKVPGFECGPFLKGDKLSRFGDMCSKGGTKITLGNNQVVEETSHLYSPFSDINAIRQQTQIKKQSRTAANAPTTMSAMAQPSMVTLRPR